MAAAERAPLRLAAVAPAVPLPREKPLRLASARAPVTMRDVAAVRSIPAREPVSARQLSAARQAAAIAPDSFATGDLFVPHATPVIADATPRYTTAAVRTASDLPPSPHVLDQDKIAAVEAPQVAAPAPQPAPRIEAVARPVIEPAPAMAPPAQPVTPAQTSIAPRPVTEPAAAAAPVAAPPQLRTLPVAAKPVQEEAPVVQQNREEKKMAKRERPSRSSHRVARVQTQPAAAPTPLGWLQQQFASLGRSLSGPQQRPSRRAAAQ
jgi:hypothetical protein